MQALIENLVKLQTVELDRARVTEETRALPAELSRAEALLAAADWADFTFVRDSLSLSDSALSKQISILEQAGYVTVRKTGAGRSRRTHLRLSPAGRRAFSAHAAILRQIITDADALTP